MAWITMKDRCFNVKRPTYKHYGGRGISICERWLTFKNFYEDVQATYFLGGELDRIDNDGDYEIKNCRWATRSTQMRNTRRNHLLTFKGKTQALTSWAEEVGISARVVSDRINKLGWSALKALTTPPMKLNRRPRQ